MSAITNTLIKEFTQELNKNNIDFRCPKEPHEVEFKRCAYRVWNALADAINEIEAERFWKALEQQS